MKKACAFPATFIRITQVNGITDCYVCHDATDQKIETGFNLRKRSNAVRTSIPLENVHIERG